MLLHRCQAELQFSHGQPNGSVKVCQFNLKFHQITTRSQPHKQSSKKQTIHISADVRISILFLMQSAVPCTPHDSCHYVVLMMRLVLSLFTCHVLDTGNHTSIHIIQHCKERGNKNQNIAISMFIHLLLNKGLSHLFKICLSALYYVITTQPDMCVQHSKLRHYFRPLLVFTSANLH